MHDEQHPPAVYRAELLSVLYERLDLDRVEIVGVGDGVLLITEEKDYLMDIIKALLSHYLRFNLRHSTPGEDWEHWDVRFHRFVRVGIGNGKLATVNVDEYHEDNERVSPFPESDSEFDFPNRPFGPAMVYALAAEKGAPLSVHEYYGDDDIRPIKWWKDTNITEEERRDLVKLLNKYFNWYRQNTSHYDPYERNHMIRSLRFFGVSDHEVDPGMD